MITLVRAAYCKKSCCFYIGVKEKGDVNGTKNYSLWWLVYR